MSEGKRGPGRPPGETYPVKKQLRLNDLQAAGLAALAEAWSRVEGEKVSESEVVRRLILKAAEEALSLGGLASRLERIEGQVRRLAERTAALERDQE